MYIMYINVFIYINVNIFYIIYFNIYNIIISRDIPIGGVILGASTYIIHIFICIYI